MSTTEDSIPRPVARAPVTENSPSSGSPENTGPSNGRLAVVAVLLATAIVVVVVLLFKIGAPGGDEQIQNPNVESRVEFDPGPPWPPNQSALEQTLNNSLTTDLETDFAGIPAPQWEPGPSLSEHQRPSTEPE